MKILGTLAALALLAIAGPVAAAAQIVDGGFETQGATVGSYCYFGSGCPTGAWTGTSGLQDEGNGAWPGQPTADGSKYGFVQTYGTLQQTFTAFDTGVFSLSWMNAGRAETVCGGCRGDQTYEVFLNSLSLGTFSTVTAQTFSAQNTGPFSLVASQNYTLTFQGLNPQGGDNTSFIDAVSLNGGGVPEPASWALMIVGFGAAGAMLRRRRTALTAA